MVIHLGQHARKEMVLLTAYCCAPTRRMSYVTKPRADATRNGMCLCLGSPELQVCRVHIDRLPGKLPIALTNSNEFLKMRLTIALSSTHMHRHYVAAVQ